MSDSDDGLAGGGRKKRRIGCGVRYDIVRDRHVDDERYERELEYKIKLERGKIPDPKPVEASAAMDAIIRMKNGMRARTMHERMQDPQRPTWEDYKKAKADKLSMQGGEVKKMIEYREQLDKEREERLAEAGKKAKKDKKNKKKKKKGEDDDDTEGLTVTNPDGTQGPVRLSRFINEDGEEVEGEMAEGGDVSDTDILEGWWALGGEDDDEVVARRLRSRESDERKLLRAYLEPLEKEQLLDIALDVSMRHTDAMEEVANLMRAAGVEPPVVVKKEVTGTVNNAHTSHIIAMLLQQQMAVQQAILTGAIQGPMAMLLIQQMQQQKLAIVAAMQRGAAATGIAPGATGAGGGDGGGGGGENAAAAAAAAAAGGGSSGGSGGVAGGGDSDAPAHGGSGTESGGTGGDGAEQSNGGGSSGGVGTLSDDSRSTAAGFDFDALLKMQQLQKLQMAAAMGHNIHGATVNGTSDSAVGGGAGHAGESCDAGCVGGSIGGGSGNSGGGHEGTSGLVDASLLARITALAASAAAKATKPEQSQPIAEGAPKKRSRWDKDVPSDSGGAATDVAKPIATDTTNTAPHAAPIDMAMLQMLVNGDRGLSVGVGGGGGTGGLMVSGLLGGGFGGGLQHGGSVSSGDSSGGSAVQMHGSNGLNGGSGGSSAGGRGARGAEGHSTDITAAVAAAAARAAAAAINHQLNSTTFQGSTSAFPPGHSLVAAGSSIAPVAVSQAAAIASSVGGGSNAIDEQPKVRRRRRFDQDVPVSG